MAQVHGAKDSLRRRAALLVRQRPALGLVAALALGIMAGAAVCGVLLAGDAFGGGSGADGVQIERGTKTDVDDRGENDDGKDESSLGDDTGHDANAGGDKKSAPSVIVVDVAGAVVFPGVVELEEGARVEDALKAAGGLAADADLTNVNRAEKLSDGSRVRIPREGEQGAVAGVVSGPAGGVEGSAGAVSADSSTGGQLVNINSADLAELDALPGVGPSTAQAIIDDRESNGPFSMPEDLMRVSGIGEKKFEKLKASICV